MTAELHDLHLPHQLTAANKTLVARYHCKSAHFTVTVPTSALPLPVHLCHCTICRYTHGTLSCFHASLPKGVEPDFVSPSSIESSLTGYIHSAQAASERFFCATCGCHVGDRDLKPDPGTGKPEWRVATSIFAAHGEDTFQIRSHAFTDPATEPNLFTWLPSISGRPIHAWNPSSSETDKTPNHQTSSSLASQAADPPADRNLLLAQCHCAGVRFTIPCPSPAEAADPYLRRYLRPDPTPSQSSDYTDDPSSTVQAPNPLKRVAWICLCRDCRLVSGSHAVPWTFVPLARIRPQISTDQLEGRPGMGTGTMKVYRSSDGVRRTFCGVCGATVLYLCDDQERLPSGSEEKRVVDVAVGILRDWEGRVAVEEWVTWRTGRLAGLESGREFDRGFAEALERGLKKWGVRRYGEKVSRESFAVLPPQANSCRSPSTAPLPRT
ncbi:hypothetical protein N658DRAFT_266916 [Parathielavia hyrcaniae]|uniref:CENP-V/GFA domain-containing protein n=1 Tax=Parathielavia hyrcaniae TaxID=113614 RepID=A0AAN6PYF0_9PEZI|nr:hypothetical protein N658DRAFT_266916 [Parathielavia hyrcaniae]